jgi:hypothetical protein
VKFKISDEEKHPVVAGLIALAAVAAALGVLAGIFALVATTVFGVGGGSAGTALASDAGASLYLPTPKPTKTQTGPLITLSPQAGQSGAAITTSASPSTSPSASPSAKDKQITLTAGKPTAGSMERIDLTGVYPGGEGAVLQVQRKDGGQWTDFPVTTGVTGGQFSTYVQTGRAGAQKWRVKDTDTGRVSNVVTVTIG